MPSSMNKVILMGVLGKDPEVRTLPSGAMLTTVSLATNDRYQDKTSGEWKETTEWHRLTFWGNNAKTAGDWLKKGAKIMVEGSIKYGQYTGQDGVTRYTTDIWVNTLYMLGHRNQSGEEYSQVAPGYGTASQVAPPKPSPNAIDQIAEHLTPDMDYDDDIPF